MPIRHGTLNIVKEMQAWWDANDGGPRRPNNPDKRNEYQRGWDAAVLAASELIRRVTNYDEELAGQIHALLTKELPTGSRSK